MPPGGSADHVAQTSRQDLSFSVVREAGAVVVPVYGDLDLAGSAQLGAVLSDLIDGQGNHGVVVDLEHVTTIDPAGLGMFAAAATVAELHGGHLEVRGSSDDVLGALAEAGLTDRLTVDGERAHGHRNHQAPTHARTAVVRSSAPDAPGRCRHVVEFYESDAFLAESVRDYMAPALRGDDAVIVVATPQHRHLFEHILRDAGVGLDGARDADRYIELDAEETLSTFMVDGRPDWTRFEETVGSLISRATAGGRTLRIYGEMVAVLWAQENAAAAMALEDLWNDLARSHEFSLFCAYPVTAFDAIGTGGSLRRICEQHSPSRAR